MQFRNPFSAQLAERKPLFGPFDPMITGIVANAVGGLDAIVAHGNA